MSLAVPHAQILAILAAALGAPSVGDSTPLGAIAAVGGFGVGLIVVTSIIRSRLR